MIEVKEIKNNMYHYWIIYWNKEELIRFTESSTEKGEWVYYSEEMKVDDGSIEADNFEEALDEFKYLIIEHCLNQQEKYQCIIDDIEGEL